MKLTRYLFAITLVLTILLINSCVGALAQTLILPHSLKVIEKEAFYGDTSIDKVVLGDKVEEIGSRAFSNSGLTEINLPYSVKKIDDTAFDGLGKVNITAEKGSWGYNWGVNVNHLARIRRYTSDCDSASCA